MPVPDWPWFYKHVIHQLLREMYADMARMEDILRGSGARDLIVRPPGLLDGPRTRRYRVTPDRTPLRGDRIRRADVADYMLKSIEADDYQGEAMCPAE